MKRRDYIAFAAGVLTGGAVMAKGKLPEGSITASRTSGDEHSRWYSSRKGAYICSFSWHYSEVPIELTHAVELPRETYETDSNTSPFRGVASVLKKSVKQPFVKSMTKNLTEKMKLINDEWIADYDITKRSTTQRNGRRKVTTDTNADTTQGDKPSPPATVQPQTKPKHGIAYYIAEFVQDFEYRYDVSTRDTPEYAQYPSETIYLGYGDCEDTTILLTSMIANIPDTNIRTGFVAIPGHVATLLAIPDLRNPDRWEPFVEIDGVEYTYVETTANTTIYGTPHKRKPEDILATYTLEHGYTNINVGKLPDYLKRGTIDRPDEEAWSPFGSLFN